MRVFLTRCTSDARFTPPPRPCRRFSAPARANPGQTAAVPAPIVASTAHTEVSVYARRLDHFATLLRKERARISALLENIAVATPAMAGGDSSSPGIDADVGAAGVGPEDDAAVVARETAALREIDDALRLIGESPHEYGICVQCGRPIPDERLEILPATRLCGRRVSGK